jgi:hypothetical protein
MCSALADKVCLPFLLNAQNEDGGWGFHAGSASRVEPTAWALVALIQYAGPPAHDEAASRALHFLELAQLPDGSWPSSPEQREGSWVTSLACFALLPRKESREKVARGLSWLCRELPGEARWFPRLIRRFSKRPTIGTQNESYYGWSWTVGTASWVEPTSYAILLLHVTPPDLLSATAKQRLVLGEAMLRDRMCPGGGWNCGNPVVYGVPGIPQASSTAWGLLALREHPEWTEVQKSISWLQEHLKAIQSPGSLALALMAMNAYGRPDEALSQSLQSLYQTKEISLSVPEVAWATLALDPNHTWLKLPRNGSA